MVRSGTGVSSTDSSSGAGRDSMLQALGMVKAISGWATPRVSCTGAVMAIDADSSLPPKIYPARRRKPDPVERWLRMVVTAWTTEPWTRGSYSCALPGQAHQREVLARPLEERLFFAGEATTVGDNSTCHGAYRSGIRAAREIAASL